MREFTMSMFANDRDLYKAKAEYFESISIELYKHLYELGVDLVESGHGTTVETILIIEKYKEIL